MVGPLREQRVKKKTGESIFSNTLCSLINEYLFPCVRFAIYDYLPYFCVLFCAKKCLLQVFDLKDYVCTD